MKFFAFLAVVTLADPCHKLCSNKLDECKNGCHIEVSSLYFVEQVQNMNSSWWTILLKWCTCQIHFILKQQLYFRPASNSASRSSTVVPTNATITSNFKFCFSIIICLNKFFTWKQLGLSIFHLCLKPEMTRN